ncbi:MAG: hypothetical protein QNJ72_44350 [Pleurocapsa sp. MO_226.B13]|nr:hypothetical protein [Pleurocapsa sp. MO_226.B13]
MLHFLVADKARQLFDNLLKLFDTVLGHSKQYPDCGRLKHIGGRVRGRGCNRRSLFDILLGHSKQYPDCCRQQHSWGRVRGRGCNRRSPDCYIKSNQIAIAF